METPADMESRRDAVRQRLQALKRAVYEELKAYPPQVAGCDLHFKDLAARRSAVLKDLRRLDELASAAELDAFVAASEFLGAED